MISLLNKQQGFTLIELAISLIILSLLLGGITIPISEGFKSAQVRSNSNALKSAKDALIGFAISNKRLPCPSKLWTGSGAGEEPSECNPLDSNYDTSYKSREDKGVLTGIVPWKTLGIKPEDSFGRPIYYAIERRVTIASDSNDISNDSFRDLALNNGSLCTNSGSSCSINIKGRDGNNNNIEVDIASNVAIVLTTLGKKNNLISPNGDNSTYINTKLKGDEKQNADSCCSDLSSIDSKTSVTFYQRKYSENDDPAYGSFDDQITWIPFYQLVGIMTQAGRLQ